MTNHNPFSPSFGGKPEHFFGRTKELSLVHEALDNPNSPNRVLFFTGNRGCGKTALLEQLSQMASKQKWLSIDVHSAHAATSLVRQLVGASLKTSEKTFEPSVEIGSASLSLGRVSASSSTSFDSTDLSDILLHASSTLKRHNGIFITIDEVQKISEQDMELICAAVQMSMRKGHPVALMLAGLPQSKERVSSFAGCTFMQRVSDIRLGSLLVSETYDAFNRLLSMVDSASTSASAIDEMARFSQGYPYLMQLIGYYALDAARDSMPVGIAKVDEAMVRYAEREACYEYCTNVLDPIFSSLSHTQLSYLLGMAACMSGDGRSRTGEVAAHLGKTAQQLSSLRQNLLSKRLVAEDGRGYVRFNLPLMRRYLTDPVIQPSEDSNDVWKHE